MTPTEIAGLIAIGISISAALAVAHHLSPWWGHTVKVKASQQSSLTVLLSPPPAHGLQLKALSLFGTFFKPHTISRGTQ
jgi:hypothetical protein